MRTRDSRTLKAQTQEFILIGIYFSIFISYCSPCMQGLVATKGRQSEQRTSAEKWEWGGRGTEREIWEHESKRKQKGRKQNRRAASTEQWAVQSIARQQQQVGACVCLPPPVATSGNWSRAAPLLATGTAGQQHGQHGVHLQGQFSSPSCGVEL